MILTVIIISLLVLISFALYCCACNTTPYDREVDDEQQMEFLQEYRKRHSKKCRRG